MRVRLLVAMVAALFGITFGLGGPANAVEHSWGNKDNCPSGINHRGTIKWNAFAGHEMDAFVESCTPTPNPWKLIWVGEPQITFQCGSGVSLAYCWAESVKVTTQPFVVSTSGCFTPGPYTCKVVFKFVVRQCQTLTVNVWCQDIAYKVYVTNSKAWMKAADGSGTSPTLWFV